METRMEHDLIFYEVSRSKVERGEFSQFLGLYGPDKLPAGRRLRDMMGAFVFAVEGWDDDPRENPTIPEIRRFYSAFHEAWPYWLYFCNLDMDTMRAMFVLAALCVAGVASAQPVHPFENNVRLYEAADRTNPPLRNAILLAGDSQFYRWKTAAEDLPGYTVINRGIDSFQTSDLLYFADRLVLPYHARLIVLHVGGNDVHGGKSPEQV
jgi:hypothetical protein